MTTPQHWKCSACGAVSHITQPTCVSCGSPPSLKVQQLIAQALDQAAPEDPQEQPQEQPEPPRRSVRSANMRGNQVAGTPKPAPAPKRQASASASDTAIVDSETLQRFQIPMARILALGILALSFFGSVLAINGGVLSPISDVAWIGGLAIQGGLTAVQWIFPVRAALGWQNLGAIIVGSAMTLGGFGRLLVDGLANVLDIIPGLDGMITTGDPATPIGATIAAWAILAIFAVLVEFIPEYVLVRH